MSISLHQFLVILTSHCPTVFDDGEVAHGLDEIWVMKKVDHEVLSDKPKDFSWIGVQKYTDRGSNDEYAKTVGWYETYFGNEHNIYTSINDALRSYDKVSTCDKFLDVDYVMILLSHKFLKLCNFHILSSTLLPSVAEIMSWIRN